MHNRKRENFEKDALQCAQRVNLVRRHTVHSRNVRALTESFFFPPDVAVG